jgi:hypothetical protein
MKAKSQSRSRRSVSNNTALSTVESTSSEQNPSAYGTVRAVGQVGKNAAVLVGKTVSSGVSTARKAQAAVDKRISDATGIEFEWSQAAVTVVSAGTALNRRHGVRRWAEQTFHDQPGHPKCFKDVNDFIDLVRGRNHRTAHGHSIEWLGQIVRKFGLRGIAGFGVHLLQDLTTVAGIPWLPFPRLAAIALRKCGLRGAVAASCVTVNLAGVIAVAGTALVVLEVGGIAYAIYGKVRDKRAREAAIQPQEVLRRLSQWQARVATQASAERHQARKRSPGVRKATPALTDATASQAPQKGNSLPRRATNGRKPAATTAR